MAVLFICRLLGIILVFYMFLISLRVLLSWFSRIADARLLPLISRLTDPYLALFRNIRFLKAANFDYSPLFGIAILIILSNILIGIADTGMVSAAAILVIIITTVFSSLFWIILFFIVLCIVRYLGIMLRKNQGHIIWSYVDSVLQPVLTPVLKLCRGKPDYRKLLVTAILLLAAIIIAGFFLVNLLIKAAWFIPF